MMNRQPWTSGTAARSGFPRSLAAGDVPRSRSATVRRAASSARAPALYRNRSSAWSRAPWLVRRSGAASRASISGFSRYGSVPFAAFLNGMAVSSAHQARCSGLRAPMKRAKACIAASRWLRVDTAQCPRGTRKMMSHLKQAYEFDIRIRLYDDRASPDGVVILAEDISEGVVYQKGGVKITAFEVDH